MMGSIAQTLKQPLHYTVEQALGGSIWHHGPISESPLISRLHNMAMSLIFGILSIPAAGVWFVGDLIEALVDGDQPFDDRVELQNIEDIKLEKEGRHYGFSLSTYQNTSDPDFCFNSDWGQFKPKMRNERNTKFLNISKLFNREPGEKLEKTINDLGCVRDGKVHLSIDICDIDGLGDPEDFLFPSSKGPTQARIDSIIGMIGRIKDLGYEPIVSLEEFGPLVIRNDAESSEDDAVISAESDSEASGAECDSEDLKGSTVIKFKWLDAADETVDQFESFELRMRDALKDVVGDHNITTYRTEARGIDILTKVGLDQICKDIHAMQGNCLRFSVEMADIYPDGVDKEPSEEAMQKYVAVAMRLKEEGITPMVTLHHFVTPLDGEGKPIFESQACIETFARYAEFVYDSMKDHVDTFFTFNEANVNTTGNYILGIFPAQTIGDIYSIAQVSRNMYQAHLAAYKRIKAKAASDGKDVNIGMTHQALHFMASNRWNYLARITAFVMNYLFHESFMQFLDHHCDSFDLLGVQFYARPLIGGWIPDTIAREGEEMEEALQHRYDPQGLFPIIKSIHERFPTLPLMETEAGTPRNDLKVDYYEKSLSSYSKAQTELPRLKDRGYLAWSVRNNFEWPHAVTDDCSFGTAHIPGVVALFASIFGSELVEEAVPVEEEVAAAI